MKTFRAWKTLTVAAASALTVTALLAMPPARHHHGTDILHLFVRKAMTNEGVNTDAAGRVEAAQNQQGNANHQSVGVSVQGLGANTAYQLLALLDDDTNLTFVADFSTDARGRATLAYRNPGGNGNGYGYGRGRHQSPLPIVLDPVSNIRELAVLNGSTQAVLTADLTAPDKLQYLIKRDLSTGNVDAGLRIKATTRQTQFRLTARGLNPTSDYLLVLNGGIEQTNTTDAKGRLAILSLLESPADILDLHGVALWDSSSNVVLSTTLP